MKPLTLAFAGLEPDDVTDFRRVFGKLRSQLDSDWRLLEDGEADLTVVDIDSIYGHMDWLKLTGSGMRAAVYTSAQYAKESDLVLFKPLQADNLADVLNAVAGDFGPDQAEGPAANAVPSSPASKPGTAPEPEAKSAPVAEAPAEVPAAPNAAREVAAVKAEKPAPTPAPKAEPETSESDEKLTVGEWLLRGAFEQPVRIAVGDEVWIIDPDREAWYGPATLKPLGKVLGLPASDLKAVDVLALEKARKGQAQPLARLRWYAGLVASPGKLMPALQGSERFGLSRWPQIEREFPRHFRIATAMMKQAGSVAELAAASGAPAADVADFVNASHAIGIVVLASREPVAAVAPRGSMMSRLRGSRGG